VEQIWSLRSRSRGALSALHWPPLACSHLVHRAIPHSPRGARGAAAATAARSSGPGLETHQVPSAISAIGSRDAASGPQLLLQAKQRLAIGSSSHGGCPPLKRGVAVALQRREAPGLALQR